MHARHDGAEITAAARAAGPGSLEYWRRRVDPAGELDPAERERRARHEKEAFYARLSMAAAAAKARKR
jgi:hypothetical protein